MLLHNETNFVHLFLIPLYPSPLPFILSFWHFQFGGGRVIRPGDVLETEEEKAVKEARTKQLLAAYKKKIGLNIDPKLKSECEEVRIYSGIPILRQLCPSFKIFFVIFVLAVDYH